MSRSQEIRSSTPVRHAKPKAQRILEMNNISDVTMPKKSSTYLHMVCDAIENIGLPSKGASFTAIKKWVIGKHEEIDSRIQIRSLKKAILKGISDGVLLRPKKDINCTGAQGSFVLSQPELSKKPSTAKNALAGTKKNTKAIPKTKATKTISKTKATKAIPKTNATKDIPKTKATKQKTQNGLTRELSSGTDNGEAPIQTPKKTRLNKIKQVINKRTSITPFKKTLKPLNQANNKQKKIGDLKKGPKTKKLYEVKSPHVMIPSTSKQQDVQIADANLKTKAIKRKLGLKKGKKPQNKIAKAQHSLSVSSVSDTETFENLINDSGKPHSDVEIEPEKAKKLGLKKSKKPRNKIAKAQHSLSVSSVSDTETFENPVGNDNGEPHSDVEIKPEKNKKLGLKKNKKQRNKIDKAQHSLSVSSVSDTETFENPVGNENGEPHSDVEIEPEKNKKLGLKKNKKPRNKIDKAQHSLSVSSVSDTETFENPAANDNGKPHSDVEIEPAKVKKTKPGKSKKREKLQSASINNEPTIEQPGKSKKREKLQTVSLNNELPIEQTERSVRLKSKPDATKPSTRRKQVLRKDLSDTELEARTTQKRFLKSFSSDTEIV